MSRLTYFRTSIILGLSGLVCLAFADIEVSALDPWAELWRLAAGIVRPDFLSVEVWSVIWTVAFAVVGVGIGATIGLALSIVYPSSAAVRRV